MKVNKLGLGKEEEQEKYLAPEDGSSLVPTALQRTEKAEEIDDEMQAKRMEKAIKEDELKQQILAQTENNYCKLCACFFLCHDSRYSTNMCTR